jgi:hypothetical protein
MLAFLGQEMVGDAKKRFQRNFQADLFASFADRAILERLQIIELASYDAPAACFGRKLPQSE